MPTAKPSTAPATPTRVSGSDQSSPARGTAPRLLASARGRHATKAGGARGAVVGLQLHIAGGAVGACFAIACIAGLLLIFLFRARPALQAVRGCLLRGTLHTLAVQQGWPATRPGGAPHPT